MKLYNSLTKTKESIEPINQNKVGVYTCGPTVYSYLTIGNWRTYTLGDVLVRSLRYLGYNVDYVMNITDVGHLTGDNLGDADTGEDRLEKASKREGKTAWDIADFYAQDFVEGYQQLNLSWPTKPTTHDQDETNRFCKATQHIDEQKQMVTDIIDQGLAYKIDDGIYFDVTAYEAAGNEYGQLSNIDQVKEGARVEPNKQKKDPRDFALWKFSPSTSSESSARQMEWDHDFVVDGEHIVGKGFPGWHIECSAMSMKYLGEQFDIHLGGEDLRSTHHPNEIAQAEAATGKKPFVKYWLHGAFLQVDGGRMGKSLGNAYTLHDIVERGFDPLDLRYFYFTGHYRKPLNFTWESLTTARVSLHKLKSQISKLKSDLKSQERNHNLGDDPALKEFTSALADDLNMPEALAVVWQVVKDKNLSTSDKVNLVGEFDKVLGLDLLNYQPVTKDIPEEIKILAKQRDQLRSEKKFEQADAVRDQIVQAGYEVEDSEEGTRIVSRRSYVEDRRE